MEGQSTLLHKPSQTCRLFAWPQPTTLCVAQEYVNELAGALVEIDKNSQDAVAAEKIKRLVNEAVSMTSPVLQLQLGKSLHQLVCCLLPRLGCIARNLLRCTFLGIGPASSKC